jgi:hypothetical protein
MTADHELLIERHRHASRALARAVERDRDAQLTIAALTKALKAQGADLAELVLANDRLRAGNDALRAEVAALKARLAELESTQSCL